MFSNRRDLRRWAAHVLLVWLFGLAMGVANACAVGGTTHHTDSLDGGRMVNRHHHDDQDADQGRANCLDLCEKSSVGAPKLKVADESTAVVWLPVLVSGPVGVIKLPEVVPDRQPPDTPHLRGSPPLRVAYQRLAL